MKQIFLHKKHVWIGLGVSLLVPSLGIIQKFVGTWFVPVYLASGFVVLGVGLRYIPWERLNRFPSTLVYALVGLTCVALIAVFAVVYPLADSGRIGPGSDHDDALNTAVTELLHGRYPYYPRTYLDGPITKLPGAVILAVPFVLLGTSAYQNIVWSGIFVAVASWLLGHTLRGLVLWWVILLFSPVFWQRFVTGGDLLANNLYVLSFSLFLIWSIQRSTTRFSGLSHILAATLFGISLSSRVQFLLLVPLMGAALAHSAGRGAAFRTVGWSLVVCAGCTLPFYAYDPAGFAPLELFGLFNPFDAIVPWASVCIVGGSVVLALVLAMMPAGQRRDDICVTFLERSAYVQAFPVLCGILFSCIESGRFTLSFADFGMNFLFFGALAAWARLFQAD